MCSASSRVDQVADVDRDLDHQEVGAAAGAQHPQRLLGALGVGDGRALVHGELGGERELAVQGSDDQETHGVRVLRSSFVAAKRVAANGES